MALAHRAKLLGKRGIARGLSHDGSLAIAESFRAEVARHVPALSVLHVATRSEP